MVVPISPDAQTTVNPNLLTFTTENWSVPQVMTVTAVNDAVVAGAHTGSITHTAASTDNNYDGIPIAGIIVNITEIPDQVDDNFRLYLPSILK